MARKKTIWFVFFILLIRHLTYGQEINALYSQIKYSRPDTSRVNLLLALSKAIVLKPGIDPGNTDSAYKYMQEADRLSQLINYPIGHGRCIMVMAMIFHKKGDKVKGLAFSRSALEFFKKMNDAPDEAEATYLIGQQYSLMINDLAPKLSYYKNAFSMYSRLNDKMHMAASLVDMADVQCIQADMKESMKNLNIALSIYQSIGYRNKNCNIYDLMGVQLTLTGDMVNGLKYELLALKSAEEVKDTTLQLLTIYNRVGMAYFYLKKFPEANEYYTKAMNVAKKYADTTSIAIVMLNQADVLHSLHQPRRSAFILRTLLQGGHFKNDTVTLEILYREMMDDYLETKEFKKALFYLIKVEHTPSNPGGFDPINLIAHVHYYIGTQQFKRCYPYLEKIQNHYQKINGLKELSVTQFYWFKADSGLNRFTSAIKHYQRYKRLNDSVFTLAKDKQTSFLQIAFETEKKDKDLELLKKRSQLQSQEARSNRNITISGFSALILLLGFVYNRFLLKRKNNQLLEHKQDKINEQNDVLQQLIVVKDKLLKDCENLIMEKDWLLKEIHHRVRNNLQIIMSLLNTQSGFMENTDAINAIRESHNRVRSISLIHQKLYISENSMLIHMKSYINDLLMHLDKSFAIREHRIRFEQHVQDISIDISQAVPVGLILNEAITNSIKYAFGPEGGIIKIDLQRNRQDRIIFTITDNGRGASVEAITETGKSLGMKMLSNLSKQLRADLTITHINGVTVVVEFKEEKSMRIPQSEVGS